jgi:hypothetical protein
MGKEVEPIVDVLAENGKFRLTDRLLGNSVHVRYGKRDHNPFGGAAIHRIIQTDFGIVNRTSKEKKVEPLLHPYHVASLLPIDYMKIPTPNAANLTWVPSYNVRGY